MESKLKRMARGMRTAAASREKGLTDSELVRGMRLVLSHDGEEWRLALLREMVYPSAAEVRICGEAFRVPEGTEPRRRTWTEERPAGARSIRWFMVELLWRELDGHGPGEGRQS